MSVVKVHRLTVVDDNHAEMEKRFAAARHIADEASHDAYAAARRERDPNTVVSHADGTMSFEKVEFGE